MAGSLPDVDALGLDDLKTLVLGLTERVARLEAEKAALRAQATR